MPAPTSTTSVLVVLVLGIRHLIFGPSWSRVRLSRLTGLPGYPDRRQCRPSQRRRCTTKVAVVTSDWEPDVLPGYWQQHHSPRPGSRRRGRPGRHAGAPRRGRPRRATHAVLLVHGFTDYFFNTELADHFAARGFAFYALDLHKCGRSRREGQTPHFTTDLARYDAELERALDIVAPTPAGARCCVYGHSAGGLIVTLWLDRLRRRGAHRGARRRRPGAQQPVPRPAGPGDPADRADVGGTDGAGAVAQAQVVRKPTEGGYGTHPAPRLRAATSTTTWTGSRSAGSRSRSAGSTRSAAGRPRCTAASTSACPT